MTDERDLLTGQLKNLTVEWVHPRTLKPYERNPRKHSSEQIKQLEKSMQEFGWTQPILVANGDMVVAGHGRLLAAGNLGFDKVPVIRLGHLTDKQARAYIIADNKLTENGTWDWERLRGEIDALIDDDYDLPITGFTNEEILALQGGDEDHESFMASFLDEAVEQAADRAEAKKDGEPDDQPEDEPVEITCPHCGGTISLS